MANPFFGGIGNLGMRPVGQFNTVPPAVVPPVAAQPVNRAFNAYQPPIAQTVAPMNSTMNAIQAITPQSNLIWIDSPDEIPNYPSGRGWQQWFGDKNAMKLYVRETDSNGVMQPVRTVWMQFDDPSPSVPQDNMAVTQGQDAGQPSTMAPASTGPSREEFNALVDLAKTTSANVSDLAGVVKSLTGKFDELMK